MKLTKLALAITLFFSILSFPFNVFAGDTYTLSSSSTWNIRISGPTNSRAGGSVIKETDLDNDGKNDLVISADNDTYLSRANSGSIYIIYNELLESISGNGSGNTIDLTDSSNYNIRIVGSLASEELGFPINPVGDVNDDGLNDLIIVTQPSDFNSRNASGSIYVIYSQIFSSINGVGNILDLANTSNYSLRFDGELSGDHLGDTDSIIKDFDNNGLNDLIISAPWFDFSGTNTEEGAIYYIPDSIIDNFDGTGNNIDLAVTSNYKTRIVGIAGSQLAHFQLESADMNSDSKEDLVVSAPLANSSRGYLYVIENSIFTNILGLGNSFSLSDTSKFSIRFDGPGASSALGNGPLDVVDYNLDGKQDIIVAAPYTFQSHVGHIYIIFNSIIDDYMSTTGNILSMSDGTSYNYRLDTESYPSGIIVLSVPGDFNGDSKPDLIFADVLASPGGFQFSGQIYVIYNDSTTSDLSTGNVSTIDTNGFDVRYSGYALWEAVGYAGANLIDYNNDGRRDVAISSYLGNYGSTKTGLFWIIYNFPHTINLNSYTKGSQKIAGNIQAPDSTTNISGIEYIIDNNSITGTWTACDAQDGAFDSVNESFSCTIPKLSNANHTIYFRAFDTNSSYTYQSAYKQLNIKKTKSTSGNQALVATSDSNTMNTDIPNEEEQEAYPDITKPEEEVGKPETNKTDGEIKSVKVFNMKKVYSVVLLLLSVLALFIFLAKRRKRFDEAWDKTNA